MSYTTLADLRGTPGMGDATVIGDTALLEAIDYADDLIDRYMGTSYEPRGFSTVADVDRFTGIIYTPRAVPTVLFPRTVTTAMDAATGGMLDVTDWLALPDVHRITTPTDVPRPLTVVVTGTCGETDTVPVDIKAAARAIARQYCSDLYSRVPDRALQLTGEYGTVTLAQPGGSPDRPTSLPEVNAMLNRRRRHLGPTVG